MPAIAPAFNQWRLRRNCCLTPRRLLGWTCLAPVLALMPALGLLLLGYPWVAFFALVQAVGIATAVLAYGRHACDGEDVSLADGELRVTSLDGMQEARGTWPASSVRVLATPADGVELLAGGRVVRVGRHVTGHRREAFVRQLKQSLAPDPGQTGENTCRRCAGRGTLDDGRACPDCGGSGRVIEPVGDA